jgi:hypothetical protein
MGAFQMYILHYWALQYLFYAQTTKSVTSPPPPSLSEAGGSSSWPR